MKKQWQIFTFILAAIGAVLGANQVQAATISGTVTADNGGAFLNNIQVCVTRRAGFSLFECTTTAVNGTYTVGNLPNEDDLIPFINNTNGQLYVLEKYIDREIHDWENSTGVDVSSSNATSINFGLADAALISGNVTRFDTGAPAGSQVRFYKAGGSKYSWTRAIPDSNGDYSVIIAPGNYFALFVGGDVFIDELYNGVGVDGIHCPRVSCDLTTLGQQVTAVVGTPLSGINGMLDVGSQISGHLSKNGSPLPNISMLFYTETGEYAGFAGSDANGDYTSFGAFPAGNYIASNRYLENGLRVREFYNLEYIAQVYNGINCGEPCNLLLGDLIALDGTNNVGNIDFAFQDQPPAKISGSLLDTNGQPVGGSVQIFNSNGDHQGDFWADGNGDWESYPLPFGNYYAVTRFTNNVIDDRWDGVNGSQCLNQLCDKLGGTPIVINQGNDVTGINLILDLITSGGSVSGHVQDGSGNPIVNQIMAVFNSNGVYLRETRTNPFGNYDFGLRADDSYYVRTHHNEPIGMARQAYNGYTCSPVYSCNDAALVSHATAIVVAGSNISNINFNLSVPVGHIVSGNVSDEGINQPLPNVRMILLNGAGNWQADTATDKFGNYYFSGLVDGDYKVYVEGVPQGYTSELYNNVPCPSWSCNMSAEGAVITVSGANVPNIDIGLSYTGTRLFGTVTRSDTSAPLSGEYRYFEMKLFDVSGNHIGGSGINDAGQYQLHVAAGDYYLVTGNDVTYHGVGDKGWNNIACTDNCNDPIGMGATLITVADGTTVVSDFVLDPTPSISGTVTAQNGGAALENIGVCVAKRDGSWLSCSHNTDINGHYAVNSLPAEPDLIVYVNNVNGQPYLLETYDNQGPYDWANATGIDISVTNATGINLSLTGATVSEQERNALVALYNSTDGANWANKTNWLVGDPCGNTWFGIVCDVDAITEINLGTNNLIGTIPSELGNLTNLIELYINENQLSGIIPPELGNLVVLEMLELSGNELTGTIPSDFIGLTQLKFMFLKENLLSGPFPAFIGSMNSLDNIWISDNLFSGPIPPELGNLTNLTWLTLSRNLLTGTIPIELKNMTSLEKIHLQENQLTGTIPPELSELTNLTQLYLHTNQLDGGIPVSLSLLNNLERLWLSSNNLSGNIPPELGSLINMQYLLLHSNQLSGDIPAEFGNFTNLLWLYLHSNKLISTIPTEISNLALLQRLRLYSNKLTGEVPTSLTNLVNLTDLNLSYNTLYSSDTNLINFMNGFCGCDWSQNQTIAPINLEVVASSSDSISLNWDSVSYQQHGGYNILMSDSISGPFVEANQTSGKPVTAYTQGNLTPGTDYYFQIQTFTFPHDNPDPFASQPNLVTSESNETIAASTSLTSSSADLYAQISSNDLLRNTNKGILLLTDIGDLVEYIIIVGNNGPDDAIGAGFRHNFPTGLINTLWTCETNTGSASCPTSNGIGNVDLILDLPVNTSLKFTFTGEVETVDEASLLITSTITPPDGVSDPDLESNDNASNFEVIFANGFE